MEGGKGGERRKKKNKKKNKNKKMMMKKGVAEIKIKSRKTKRKYTSLLF